MADAAKLKRPHPEDDSTTHDGKRARSNNGSPVPTSNGSTAAPKPDIQKMVAEAKARAEAIRAKHASALGGIPSAASAPAAGSAMDRMAQLKARVAAATGRASAIASSKPEAPRQPPPTTYAQLMGEDGFTKARGGLDVGLHPALMGESQQDGRGNKARGAMQPKFSTTMGNRQTESPAPAAKKAQLDISGPTAEEIKANPYYDASLGPKNTVVKGRKSRELVFNLKGKYIAQAAALRRQAQLEAMKKRIAEHSRKAGVEEDLDAEKAFLVPEPPKIEWWDEGLVNGSSYDAISDPSNLKIDTEDSIITVYIQHPVLLEPPQEKIIPAAKPMFLTSKEQAKLRRQRRMAELKEQQAKIRLGLEPAPAPKVKKSNLMRVLGEEAVKDPTAVEARVNREIAERKEGHEEMNEERKLTKDEKVKKREKQQEEDAARGIHVRVYKIDTLANGKQRYKIGINAEQNKLTGVCVMHPKMCIVVVEGGEHSIRNYEKLMEQRIKWAENDEPNRVKEGNKEALEEWLEAVDEHGELKDLSLNRCECIFKGEEKRRAFWKWWGMRACETEAKAKEVLAKGHMDSFWNVAKNFQGMARS
jgi:U4/U6 small nuclear ribonucleoprotein PRP3